MSDRNTTARSDRPLLQVKKLCKKYGDTSACDRISFSVSEKTIHCVLGENGAGKSSLMRNIFGLEQPDSGHLCWLGETTVIPSPRAARDKGIAMVFQEFSLVEEMTVIENLYLYLGPTFDWEHDVLPVQKMLDTKIKPHSLVNELSAGEKQQIEILRSILISPSLLILDEPTSILTMEEAKHLMQTLRALTQNGITILLITHKLEEAIRYSDQITVLRRGKVVSNMMASDATKEDLAELIIGSKLIKSVKRKKNKLCETKNDYLLSCKRVSTKQGSMTNTHLKEVTFSLRPGEILGIGGMAGQGQGELNSVLSSKDIIKFDEIQLFGNAQIFVMPEERDRLGCTPNFTLSQNLLITKQEEHSPWINFKSLDQDCRNILRDFDVRGGKTDSQAKALSGGNLQKFLVGRALSANPDVLVCNNPTWGVDLNARESIHQMLSEYANNGASILLISQDVDEILYLADKVAVMCQGYLSPTLDRREITEVLLGSWMSDSQFKALKSCS